MDRRALLGGALGISVLAATGGAAARESSFDALLAELESDPTSWKALGHAASGKPRAA